ncbi:molybdopterin biosynthesis protein [Desulfuromonas versatilis]|uniref:Molybdopterin molybdenumtransferase n=1 Tax=Desulfuromonas versatilis TaxID=2802975 RepID=A0ABM8HNV6_9BACT|nr:molybdopterin biosynthesis protein [Desulfuromonas versatilis]BCR03254.1 molybdopterin biosynthesis protein [Desulfuromonas versatilis]
MSKRNIYLKTIPVAEALERARAALDREALVGSETVPAHLAAGRVTAAPVHARLSSPAFHSAAMDGIAVKAEATFTAREGHPLRLEPGRDFFPVNTGQPLPGGTDAVIKIEDVVQDPGGALQIEAPAFPWMHVRRIGQDIVATELMLPQNHPLSAYDVGALLSAGIWELEVWQPLRICFIPTGDEVLDFATRPQPAPGQVVESNSQVLAALAKNWGARMRWTAPVPDDPERIRRAVEEALASEAQVVVVGAGSSAGTRDFTSRIFAELGEVLAHGLAVSPGKPTLIGTAAGKLLVGAPGYPGSAIVCFEEVLAPLVAWLGRAPAPSRERIEVRITRKTPSRLGAEEMLRLAVGKIGEEAMAVPLGRGPGMITNLTRAQALVRVPAGSEGLEQDERVSAELLVPAPLLESVLVHVGSHDNTLDLLSNELMGRGEPLRLVSSNVGSLGGLTALRAGSAMFAGVHLFDPQSGDFNFPFLEKYLPGLEVVVVNLAIRHQGLIVPAGNPKNIRDIHDLAREDVGFINRQRGAGTRILLDYHLKQAGIAPARVRGYEREEYTHMAVAVNVLTGSADAALGIRSAAKALGLDFVPLARERYDLVIPARFTEDHKILTLIELLQSEPLIKQIDALGGYETPLTGRIMHPGMGLEG